MGRDYFNVRFTNEVGRVVRRQRLWRRGDLSRRVVQAVCAVDLKNVALLDLGPSQSKEAMTQVSVPDAVSASLREWAVSRNCSVNRLINSAVLTYYGEERGAN